MALFFLTVTNNWNDLLYPLVNSVREPTMSPTSKYFRSEAPLFERQNINTVFWMQGRCLPRPSQNLVYALIYFCERALTIFSRKLS